MKHITLTVNILTLLLALLASVGCGVPGSVLRETLEAEIRPTVVEEARQTADVTIETTVAATLTFVPATPTAQVTPTATPPHIKVAVESYHGQHVTAKGGGGCLLYTSPSPRDRS